MRVLVLNAGSSSLKASVVESSSDATLAESTTSWSPDDGAAQSRSQTVASAIAELTSAAEGTIRAIGHRIVHGGTAFNGPTIVDDDALEQIEALDELAPLHNRIAAETIRTARRLLPEYVHAGSIDPGILLYILRAGMEADELADALEHRSGLLAVSETTADVALLERAAAAGDGRAGMALAIYARRAAAGIAAAATALERLDALVF